MMLYKLSLSNIRKSFKDYAICFFTLILGVCIFYVFNSLDSQTAMLEISSRTNEMVDLLVTIISGVSIFVSCVLGFLIIYSSRFLIKKRNKEFGIYLTLGMSKRKISTLLLIETLLIGVISLCVGLLLGIVVSQLTSILVANLFEVNMTKFVFNFSSSSFIKTIIYFGIIYFIVMIFNTINVNKYKLIDLLHSSKKSEKINLKNPILSIILFVISAIFLGIAYYMVTDGFFKIFETRPIELLLLPIFLGVIGTILFFYSVAGLALRIISKCKNLYYRELNSFIFKDISSKINTMVFSISIICVMLFFTICLLSSAFSIKNYFNDSIEKYSPTDFNIVSYVNGESNYLSKEELEGLIKNDNLIKNNTKNITVLTTYYDNNFLYKESLGDVLSSIELTNLEMIEKVDVISLSDYNKIAKLNHLKEINLEKDEYQIVSNFNSYVYDEVMKNNNIFNIFGTELKPHSKKTVNGFITISANPANLGFVVVSDDIINRNNVNSNLLIGNYKTNDEKIIKQINSKFDQYENGNYALIETVEEIKDGAVGVSAIATFVGLYLGLIFLISSAAILALKELSDAIDDKEKYTILRKIGTDENMIKKALFKQTLIFFMLPLFLAIIHSIVGIKFCLIILKSLGITNLNKAIFVTAGLMLLIYGGYFLITYYTKKSILKNK